VGEAKKQKETTVSKIHEILDLLQQKLGNITMFEQKLKKSFGFC